MKKTSLLLLVPILLLAACAPVAPQSPGQEPAATASPPATTPPEPGPSLEPAPGDTPVLIYHRSGGIAGIIETWRFYPDGRVESEDAQRQAAPIEVSGLVQEIVDLGFFELEESYVPKDTCCDRFFYEVTVTAGDQIKTVKTLDGTAGVPNNLEAVLALVSGFVSSQSNGG